MSADHRLWNRVSFHVREYILDPRNEHDKDCSKYKKLAARFFAIEAIPYKELTDEQQIEQRKITQSLHRLVIKMLGKQFTALGRFR